MRLSPQHATTRRESGTRRQRDGGYLLLGVMLLMALMIIAATIEAPAVIQQLKRDREEEMIHRGTEYARAIKKFYKKFGRYPSNLDQLDNTNQIRFLRKRYKDPLTKDGKWKLLNYGDMQTLLNATTPGTPAATLGSQGQGSSGSSASGGSIGSTLPQPPALNPNATSPGQSSSGTTGFGNLPPGPGGAGNAGFSGQNPQQGTNPFASTFSLGSSSSNPNQPGGTTFSSAASGQTFGGGAIIGVASTSTDPTIRIYNKKKTYDEWVFIYNPMMDQMNVLLRGPYQPITIGNTNVGTPAGQLNQQQGGFGQSGGFGSQQQNPQQQPQQQLGPQFPPDQYQRQP